MTEGKRRIAVLAPIGWRVPPRHYGPWEWATSILTEGLVRRGHDVTLFATKDAVTSARLEAVVPSPYWETPGLDVKVMESLHCANAFEQADRFDVISNQADFVPLTYSRMVATPVVTTIHGINSQEVLSVYEAYDDRSAYVAISKASREPTLTYSAVIPHGIPLDQFAYSGKGHGYLLSFARLHPDKGIENSIRVARACGRHLVIAGIIADRPYFDEKILPELGMDVVYVGSVKPHERSRLLGEADALLHLISFEEPFGFPVVEAMATGTPVIGFRRGALPETIVDGVTGFLVDDVAAAVEAVGRIGEIDRATCRAHVEQRFGADRMAEDYERAFERVLAQRRSAVL